MSLFARGDLVVSNISEQGLVKGGQYKVTGVVRARFGVVYYEVRRVEDSSPLPGLIVNGHFFLDLVSE